MENDHRAYYQEFADFETRISQLVYEATSLQEWLKVRSANGEENSVVNSRIEQLMCLSESVTDNRRRIMAILEARDAEASRLAKTSIEMALNWKESSPEAQRKSGSSSLSRQTKRNRSPSSDRWSSGEDNPSWKRNKDERLTEVSRDQRSRDKSRRSPINFQQDCGKRYRSVTNDSIDSCMFCDGNHLAEDCHLDTRERRHRMIQRQICFRCTKAVWPHICHSFCDFCGGRHHQLFCIEAEKSARRSKRSRISYLKNGSPESDEKIPKFTRP